MKAVKWNYPSHTLRVGDIYYLADASQDLQMCEQHKEGKQGIVCRLFVSRTRTVCS